jgi:type II secretory pathway pseudopilin PulG
MNFLQPYLMWIKIAAVVLVLIGAFVFGYRYGSATTENAQARDERVAHVAFESAQQAAAAAIGKLQITQTTIQGRVEREVRVEKDYSGCHHSPDAFGLLNDALENRSPSDGAGKSELPATTGGPTR